MSSAVLNKTPATGGMPAELRDRERSVSAGLVGGATAGAAPTMNTREHLFELISGLAGTVGHAISEIEEVNAQTKLLSLNARIEAARAGGTTGAAFGIVAEEIQGLSANTTEVAARLSLQTRQKIEEVKSAIEQITRDAQGLRLSDLALTNIDLIDRNLYERSCDVRWWATDSSVVQALTTGNPDDARFAGERLGIILNAYTVYLDLVLCNQAGVVIANGRPDRYHSRDTSQAGAEWFRSAMSTTSGNEFGFESVHASPLVNGQSVLAYSCTVRMQGNAGRPTLGVLGILFNWDALGQHIVEHVPLADADRAQTRCLIVDHRGIILADSEPQWRGRRFDDADLARVLKSKKGFHRTTYNQRPAILAYAPAPGFETYSTGWTSIVVQTLAQ